MTSAVRRRSRSLILVPLFVTLAFVGDAGLLYWEKVQLQNGADAAALAVAQDCAKRGTACTGGAGGLATGIAGANANDGQSAATIASLTANRSAATSTVEASSPNGNGVGHSVRVALRAAGGHHGRMLGRAPNGALLSLARRAFALTIAECEFDDLPPQDASTPNPVRTWLLINNGSTGEPCASGAPGGFGWLDGTNCSSTISIDAIVGGEVGVQPNPNKNGCSANILAPEALPDPPDPALLVRHRFRLERDVHHLAVRRLQAHGRQDRWCELRRLLRWIRTLAAHRRTRAIPRASRGTSSSTSNSARNSSSARDLQAD